MCVGGPVQIRSLGFERLKYVGMDLDFQGIFPPYFPPNPTPYATFLSTRGDRALAEDMIANLRQTSVSSIVFSHSCLS